MSFDAAPDSRRGSQDVVSRERLESFVEGVLFVAAFVAVLTSIGIVVVLLWESVRFFQLVSPVEFFTARKWTPTFSDPAYGVLPLANGTFMIVVGSGVLAIPIGLMTAVYLSEYASGRVRSVVKPALEILAGIPSVVLGFFAVVIVSSAIRLVFPATEIYNAASASVAVAVMLIPMIASLSEDALRSVPLSLREAGFALGATKFEVTLRIVVPAAASGIIASIILAVSRAIGETMAVAMAAGKEPQITLNFLQQIQTMTGYVVEISSGDVEQGTAPYLSLFAVCLTLFVMTLSMNIVAQWFLSRVRERYE